jgi:hypothetical protein
MKVRNVEARVASDTSSYVQFHDGTNSAWSKYQVCMAICTVLISFRNSAFFACLMAEFAIDTASIVHPLRGNAQLVIFIYILHLNPVRKKIGTSPIPGWPYC